MAKKKVSKAKTKIKAKTKTRTRTPAKAKRKAGASAGPGAPNRELNGWITHTEFASTDPDATQLWLQKVLAWKFRPSFPMPDGSRYLLFTYSERGGGGIRVATGGEDAGTVPYVQVANVRSAFDKAIREGADEMIAPNQVMEDLWIACVRAPGGVVIGFAGPK